MMVSGTKGEKNNNQKNYFKKKQQLWVLYANSWLTDVPAPDVGGWPWDRDSGAGTAAGTQRIILPLTVSEPTRSQTTQGRAKLWA